MPQLGDNPTCFLRPAYASSWHKRLQAGLDRAVPGGLMHIPRQFCGALALRYYSILPLPSSPQPLTLPPAASCLPAAASHPPLTARRRTHPLLHCCRGAHLGHRSGPLRLHPPLPPPPRPPSHAPCPAESEVRAEEIRHAECSRSYLTWVAVGRGRTNARHGKGVQQCVSC